MAEIAEGRTISTQERDQLNRSNKKIKRNVNGDIIPQEEEVIGMDTDLQGPSSNSAGNGTITDKTPMSFRDRLMKNSPHLIGILLIF